MPTASREYSDQERAAVLAWHLAHGARFTSEQAGALVGLSRKSACRLLNLMARVLPLVLERRGALWYWSQMRE